MIKKYISILGICTATLSGSLWGFYDYSWEHSSEPYESFPKILTPDEISEKIYVPTRGIPDPLKTKNYFKKAAERFNTVIPTPLSEQERKKAMAIRNRFFKQDVTAITYLALDLEKNRMSYPMAEIAWYDSFSITNNLYHEASEAMGPLCTDLDYLEHSFHRSTLTHDILREQFRTCLGYGKYQKYEDLMIEMCHLRNNFHLFLASWAQAKLDTILTHQNKAEEYLTLWRTQYAKGLMGRLAVVRDAQLKLIHALNKVKR